MATNVASILPAEVRRSGIQIGPAYSNGQGRAEAILGLPFATGLRMEVVEVTPGKAQMLLAAMPPQRPLAASRVTQLAKAIRAGRWQVTHQGLAFDEKGQLIDGQHRLTACVEADMPIRIVCAFNVPSSSVSAIDRGRIRVIADDLVMSGIVSSSAHAQTMQAAARIIRQLEAGKLPWVTAKDENPFTVDDAISILNTHPKLEDTAAWVITHRKRGLSMPAAPFVAFLTLFREINESKAMRFAEDIVSGVGLNEDDPAYVLRDTLMQTQRAPRSADSKRAAFMVRLVFAWNAYWAGRKLTRLFSVARTDEFPKIAGYRG